MTPTSFAFIGVLDSLNIGTQLMVAGSLVLTAWYVIRVTRVGSSAVSMASTVATISVGVLTVAAVAIGLGWADPNPAQMVRHLGALVSWIASEGASTIRDAIAAVRRAVGL